MHFAEAIFNFAEAICSFCENIDQLSPVEAGTGTELGNKINVFYEVGSKFIRFGLVSLLNLCSTLGP